MIQTETVGHENKKLDWKNFLWNTNQNFHNETNLLQVVFDFITNSAVP